MEKSNLKRGSHHLAKTFIVLTLLLTVIFAVAGTDTGYAEPSDTDGMTPTKWSPVPLPTDTCNNGGTKCHYGAPTLAHIDDDNFLDIVAVTNNGHVVAMHNDGSIMWDTDIAPHFGMDPGTHEIHSKPAVADIDGDGKVEIVLGAGTMNPNVCTQGGLIVLDHNGQVEPGWPFLAADDAIPPAGCRDSIVSSPALGDLDNDGDLEIVTAGFDKRIYAWHHDGTLLPGFPPSSYLSERFPTWPSLQGKLADNTWASPALSDLDGDGYLDIVLGTGEGNFDDRYGGDANGWECPYELPPGWASGYCGGSLYALDRFGDVLPGFPKYILEVIGSSPSISDVNGDGAVEIFVGTGDFYYVNSPDHPTHGFRVFGFDGQGNDLPGWEGGKSVGGTVMVSPSIGDIAGDERPEIVVIAMDKKLYAWHQDGSLVEGFPMTPRDYNGKTVNLYNTVMGLVLADYDGDSKMEIVFNQGGTVNVVDGSGEQLTGTNFPDNTEPIYYAEGILLNTPAVGDIDNDGKLELVVTNDQVFAWDWDDSNGEADWAMFKRDAAGAGYLPPPPHLNAPDEIVIMHDVDNSGLGSYEIVLNNQGQGSLQWSSSTPNGVTLSPSSGSFTEEQSVQVTVNTSGYDEGTHNLGDIVITATSDGETAGGSPQSIAVQLFLADLQQTFLPTITR